MLCNVWKIGGKEMNLQKDNRWRSKPYRDWVKAQPSIISGLPADDPHHVMGHGLTGGVKAPDWSCFPLTRAEHNNLHDIGYEKWEEFHGCQLDHLVRFWLMNFEAIREFM